MRKTYLDNIRSSAVLLVAVYHVCYLFHGAGIPGGIPGARSLAAFDALACAVYPWIMALLFLAAGMSARYSLQKRTGGEFIRERVRKLLIPSTLGLFVVHWITGYLNLRIGGALAYLPPPLVYPISVLSGIGPLWFVQMLFLFSCALLLLRKLDPADRVWRLCGRLNAALLPLLFFVLWGAAQILNAPVLTMYRFGIYFAAFLIGYYVFTHESVQNAVEKIRIPMLIAAAAGGIAYTACYFGSDYTAPACLQSPWTNLYLWAAVLAILGCGKRYFNRETAVTRYLAQNSFGIYVLHYPVLLAACWFLHGRGGLPVLGNYLAALAAGLGGAFLLNEIVKRIPILAFAVLGRRREKGDASAGQIR